MLYFQLLFLFFAVGLFSQTVVIDDLKYKTILWDDEKDEFHKKEFTRGSFLKNENDLILCKGRMWKGNPPNSLLAFTYKEKSIENMGEFNNEAVKLLERNEEGNWSEANSMLNAMISFDPLFFPARYNYARFLYMQKSFKEASYEFIQAKNIIPTYYRTYLHLGQISIYLGKKQDAEEYWKQAVWRNSLNDEATLALAEMYWKEGLIERAKERIKEADKVNDATEATIIRRQTPAFPVLDFTRAAENPNANPNPKIAEALMNFHQEKYALAYKIFKSIDTANLNKEKIPYLKKMHYYFAESAIKILDQKTAATQYAEMLKYPFDPFFQEIAASTVTRKMNLASSVK
jgi:tetratricopeptide (TPR) repeat protein